MNSTIAKLLAQLCGWREAHDADEGTLVVFHPRLSIHFSGPLAWENAVRESRRSRSVEA